MVAKTREGSSILRPSRSEKTREASQDPVSWSKTREGSSILKPSRSGVEKTRKGSKVSVSGVEKIGEGSSILKLFRSEVEKARAGSKYPVLVSKKRARGFLFWNYSGPRSKNARGVEVSRPVPGPGPGTHPHCVPSPPYEPLCKKLKGRFWCRQHGQPLDTGQPFNSGHPWIVDP